VEQNIVNKLNKIDMGFFSAIFTVEQIIQSSPKQSKMDASFGGRYRSPVNLLQGSVPKGQ